MVHGHQSSPAQVGKDISSFTVGLGSNIPGVSHHNSTMLKHHQKHNSSVSKEIVTGVDFYKGVISSEEKRRNRT